jgi:biofilm PGA synthesis N-glycosyltransferase PgaC
MKWWFWGSMSVIVYTYAGYPAWLWLRSRWRPRVVHRSPDFLPVSIVMVAHNEEKILGRKIENLLSLNYPKEKFELHVVSDGSTDRTEEILRCYRNDSRVKTIFSPQRRGKAACLNDGIGAARGAIVLFTDVRQEIENDALRLLVENFADRAVGAVSGELMLGEPASGEAGVGMGLYWRVEKVIRKLESCSGSVVGATGALYAVRRELLAPLPPETVLDDVYVPMNVVRRGLRVVFDGRARAWDSPHLGGRREFARKVRTLSGNYQLLQLAPWLLSSGNPIRFEFVSHKIMRLVIPFALVILGISSALIRSPFYRIALIAQAAFYLIAILARPALKHGQLGRVAGAAWTFVVLNAAALIAFKNFVIGRKTLWTTGDRR